MLGGGRLSMPSHKQLSLPGQTGREENAVAAGCAEVSGGRDLHALHLGLTAWMGQTLPHPGSKISGEE